MTIHPYALIKGLRTVRRFKDEAVTEAHLQAILEAARWTGSSKNRQNWAFVVVDEQSQRERLATAGDFTQPVIDAPLFIALVALPEGYEFDIGRVAQNVMLASAAIGVGSCPITLHREELASELLGLPAQHRCRYGIALGYEDAGAERAHRGQRNAAGMTGRKALDELVHHNRWAG